MRRLIVILSALVSLLAWCPVLEAAVTLSYDLVEEPPAALVIPRDVPLQVSAGELKAGGIRILIFGDSGTGDEDQMKVALGMRNFCAKHECHLALMLGDNIHPAGVQSADDPQFIEKFEKPYAGLGIPIFAILGEHDWGRRGALYNWKAQIEYTKKSKIWRMPSDVYSVTFGELKILALNTNSIPTSKTQASWLRDELDKSKARWNVVMGHKPIHSYGYHGDTDFMIADILPILCGRADLYLSAHEHNQQVLKADCGLPLVISGSAGKLRPELEEGLAPSMLRTNWGLPISWLKKNELTVQMVSATGEVNYQLVIPKTDTGEKALNPTSLKP